MPLMYCPDCGKQVSTEAPACLGCGRPMRSIGATTALGGNAPSSPAGEPVLWNPNAIANWSVLFTPIFGSALSYLNWKALGERERARTALIWVWVSVAISVPIFLVSVLADGHGPYVNAGERVGEIIGRSLAFGWSPGLIYLGIWYLATGRTQSRYIRDTYGRNYVKRSWGRPLFLAVLG